MNSSDDTIATWVFVSHIQYWLVMVICILSLVVLSRAMKMLFHIKHSHYFLYLLCIVAADLLMLIVILTELSSQTFFPLMKGPFLCKIMHFVSNVGATFANWTWVLMFVQRFSLVFFPMKRSDAGIFGILHSSRKLLILNLVFSTVTQSWALLLITERQVSSGENGHHVICERDERWLGEAGYKWVAVLEAICTYVLPFLCTLATDLAVLVWHHRSSRFTLVSAEGVGHKHVNGDAGGFKIQSSKSIQSHLRRRQRAIRRCLAMATVQVALNAPHYTLQVVDEMVGMSYSPNYSKLYFYLDAVLYLLYLCQFPIVTVYILFLYRENKKSKKNVSRVQSNNMSASNYELSGHTVTRVSSRISRSGSTRMNRSDSKRTSKNRLIMNENADDV